MRILYNCNGRINHFLIRKRSTFTEQTKLLSVEIYKILLFIELMGVNDGVEGQPLDYIIIFHMLCFVIRDLINYCPIFF